MARTVEIGLLGPVLVCVDGAPVRLASTPQRVILARLALAGGRPASVAALIGALWPDDPPPNAVGNLQAYVSKLRQVVGADRITREPAGYRLGVPAEQIDIGRAEALVAAARDTGDPAGAARLFGAALALWRGEPLADLPEPAPFAPDLARLAGWRRQVGEEWFTARLAAGEAGLALPDLEHAATADPDREGVHVLLATALHHLGRTADALRVLADFRRRLADEHGLDPGPALTGLTTLLLTGDPSVAPPRRQAEDVGSAVPDPPGRPAGPAHAVSHDPEPAATAVRTTVAGPMNRYVGRERDLAAVEAGLGGHRLVTVVGPGGIGKTRLSLELLGRRPAGERVYVVELALVSRADDVPLAAAAAIGLTAAAGSMDVIADVIGDGRVLIVLDNCEHVRDAARDLVAGLLARCPGLRVLATSRQRLGVPAEKVVRLGPLAPDDQVELFCDRAALLRDDFQASPEARRLAGEICRTLDGLPLAVELAASREAVFGLRQLRDRLAAGLDILEPARDPDRTTAVTATVEWSYRLLDPAAQRVFDALVVCRGGFPLEALPYLAPDVARPEPLLADLVEASLVVSQPGDRPGDPPRFRLLEVMRRIGLDHVGAHDLPAARDRHAAWMIAFAERCHALQRDRSPQVTVLVRAELANLREALAWLVDTRRWPDAGRLGVLAALLLSDNPDLALLAQLDRLAAVPADVDAQTAGRCAAAAGTARWLQGDRPVAERLLTDALNRLPADHPERWIGQFFRLTTYMFGGDLDAMRADAEALLAGPDVPEWIAAVCVCCVALSSMFSGDRAAGERWLSTHSALLDRVRAMDGFIDYTHGEFAAQTDPHRALDLLDRARRQSIAVGQRYDGEIAAIGRMAVLIRLGRGTEAARSCRASIERLRTSGMWPQLWTALRLTAELLVGLGDHAAAALLLAAAEHDPVAPAVAGPDLDRRAALWAAAEEALGPEGVATARSRAAHLKRAAVAEHAIAALTAHC